MFVFTNTFQKKNKQTTSAIKAGGIAMLFPCLVAVRLRLGFGGFGGKAYQNRAKTLVS